jgi:hypothetical protein
MDATASGASSVAGRETVSKSSRAYDTALTASSHGFGREHTPALEATCEDVRGRPSRVVLTPGVCASSPVVMCDAQPGARVSHPQDDGGNSASLPGESTKYAVNHRAGKAEHRLSLWSTPCAFLRRTDLRVPPAPGLPCALVSMRAKGRRKTRAKRAARTQMRVCGSGCELNKRNQCTTLRHCERSEAIQAVTAEGFWIASRSLSSGRALRGPVGSQ